MAQINVNNLTFAYEGSLDNVFANTSFTVDTNWRLGFIGRNSNKVVVFEGKDELIGKVINLEIISEHKWYLKGQII